MVDSTVDEIEGKIRLGIFGGKTIFKGKKEGKYDYKKWKRIYCS